MKPYKSVYKESEFDVSPENSFVKEFLGILAQVKIFHWQTYGYAEHTALGSYYDAMSDFIDSFVESYQGEFGREYIKSFGKSDLIGLCDYSLDSDQPKDYIGNTLVWLKELRKSFENKVPFNSTALQNIIDEMIGETQKLSYLLTLK